jgi:hypothetical protein
MVALEGSAASPRVILRRRLELLDRGIQGAAQPYHTAAEMNLPDAEAFLDRCRESTHAAAGHAMRESLEELARKGYQVSAGCVLQGSGRNGTDLRTILGSHPLLHTAEGQFYRGALQAACVACGVTVACVKEKEASATTARALGFTPDELERRIAELGKLIGPPWRQDQKLSAMGAWLVLAGPSS